jgi:hypothetical protein
MAGYKYRKALADKRKSGTGAAAAGSAPKAASAAIAPIDQGLKRRSALRYGKLLRAYGESIDRRDEAAMAIVRSAVAATMQLEAMQRAIRQGETVQPGILARLANSNARLLGQLKAMAPKPAASAASTTAEASTLAAHLARKAAERQALERATENGLAN